jgi:aspartate/methionine/tyrosine aminotransferase
MKSTKTTPFENTTIWYKYGRLASSTGSVNLGQGFPDWSPPEFYLESLIKNFNNPNVNHQYTRSLGSIPLCEAVAKTYSPSFGRTLDPMNEVLIVNGGVSMLYNTITAFVEQGDEVIVIEPFYETYYPEVILNGGKVLGVPMIPPKLRNKSEFLYGGEDLMNHYSNFRDEWKIDFDAFEKSLSNRTSLVILNTPNNPTGKILTTEELTRFAKILEKYPNVVVLMDEVYEYMIYDDFKTLPRMANIQGMWDRTITMMSAGKFFSATGCRIGWGIGPRHLLKKVNAVYQYNSFCLYEPIQLAIADSLQMAEKPYKGFNNYYLWLRNYYLLSRNYFVQQLANCDGFNLNFYIPEGSYFILASLADREVMETNYRLEGDEKMSGKYLKDYNYLIEMAHRQKIVGIPCNVFYTDVNKHIGQNFVRFAFCKIKSTMDKAIHNMRMLR